MSIPPLETIGDVVPATGAELASESTDSNGGLVSQTENSAGVAEEPGSHKSVGQKNVVEVSQRDVETGKGKTYGIITIPDGVSAGDALRVEFECDESLRDSPADVHRLLIKLPEGIECGKQLEVTECIVLTADVGPSRLSNDKIALYATHYLQENTMSIIAIILAFLDLGENVFTTFQFSSDFSFGAVLTTFLVIDIIKAEARAFSHCCLKSTMIPLLLLLTLVEAVQAVAYMYFCKFSNASVIYFIVFAVVQVLLMFPEEVDGVKSYLRYREKMEHIISTTMNDEEAETARMNEFVGNCCSRPLSVGMIVVLSGLSYSYTASDSPFQSLWFQVLLTIYVWYISVGYDWILSVYYQAATSEEPVHQTAIAYAVLQQKLPQGIFIFVVYGLVLFAIGVNYYKTADLEYDYVLCIFAIIGGSFIFCLFCILLCNVSTLLEGRSLIPELKKEDEDVDPAAVARFLAGLHAQIEAEAATNIDNNDTVGSAATHNGSTDDQAQVELKTISATTSAENQV